MSELAGSVALGWRGRKLENLERVGGLGIDHQVGC
jgi:hypothetical protein